MKRKFLFLFALIILITGCSKSELSSNSVKISPSELFKGDTKSLKPHMDMITGCVDVNYKGNKEITGLKYEIWENGILKTEENIFSSTNDENGFNEEISISLKDIISSNLDSSEKMKMTTVFRRESGYSSSTKYIDTFNKEYGYSPQELQDKINSTDEEEIAIWGLAAGDILSAGGEDIESGVKKSEWGLILKLYFE